MRIRRLLWYVACMVALLLAASWGISGALEYGWARRSLLARLSESFGRPVEADSFSFSLLDGPQLEVHSISVSEDPRFGQEYFLRADQLTVGLLWTSLLRGRVEFGTLFLSHPSLNLVHTPDGHWNVESWLPPTNDPAAAAKAAPRPFARHLGRIDIDNGRINFKLGQEKLLFALADVSGELDEDDSGRWSLDLQAIPMRASILLQQTGTVRLRGTVAGTSARLRPAALNLTWEDGSLADALRLASGQDYSVRGLIGAEFTATIKEKADTNPPESPTLSTNPKATAARSILPDRTSAAGEWNITGTLRLSGIHRWDLPARATDPAVNVTVAASWSPGTPQLSVARCLLQSAHSQLVAGGDVDWSHGFNPSVQITSSSIDLGDLFAWRRSFRTNVDDALTMEGLIGLQADLAAWPPRIDQASISSTGADIRLAALPPIHIGAISATLRQGSLVLQPVSVSLPNVPVVLARAKPSGTVEQAAAPAGTLRVDGVLGPFHAATAPLDWHYRLAVSGETERVQDLVLVMSSLGRPANAGWAVAGPASFQLAWAGVLRNPEPSPTGTIRLDALQLTTALLNQPLLLGSAGIELRPGQRHVKLDDAQAFGTHWKGTLDQPVREGAWHFDLSAARLDVADLDFWLGPRARPSLLARLMPFTSSGPPSTPGAMLQGMVTSGRLRVGELSLGGLLLEKLDADVELDGPSLALRRAQADLFDGRVTGDFEAHISAAPTYSFQGQFERVNLAALASATSALDGRFAGIAAGNISFAARGIGREQLLASLTGAGKVQVREAVLRGLELPVGTASDTRVGSESRFTSAVGRFRVGNGLVQVDQLSMLGREQHLEVQGSVSLARRIDLHVWSLPHGVDAAPEPTGPADRLADRGEWTIGGTLDAPQLTGQVNAAGNGNASTPTPTSTAASAPIATRR